MEFGVTFPSRIRDYRYVQMAEKLGYDQCWFYDSQMIYSDVYATMALAAEKTSSIKLGTGVAVIGTRIAPTIAHSIATINELAPGRVELGLGTGYTAWRTMGMTPKKLGELKEHFEVIRSLLNGKTVDYKHDGQKNPIKMLHPDQDFINIDDPIDLSLSAFGPKTLRYTGAEADAHLTWGATGQAFNEARSTMEEGAKEAGRDPDEIPTKGIYPLGLVREGESEDSKRVIRSVESFVMNALHGLVEREDDVDLTNLFGDTIPTPVEDTIDRYIDHVQQYPDERRHLQLHEGHLIYANEEERNYITPELANELALIGEPDEIIEVIKELEEQGLSHFALQVTNEPAEQIAHFATTVMERY